ncbi:helix-turn-helix transcriptional regulator [Vogesella sp. LIG4]|uniref:helix-turn-helix domain-containing protein n=1 Tax=Vogesella sp. LIG4 TaxID=1192162 RepID=UPI00081F9467|nr:helix-turn-helix transcriptional regulator [Vogesella sp. LIG4]SCK15977.1 Response regulator containing a CheY-like receiver domain and an HTH DNA-binding domain [Vogesella sp. LIG4]
MTKGIPFACGHVSNGLTHTQLTTLLQWFHTLPQLDSEQQLQCYLDSLAEESGTGTLQIHHGPVANQGWLGTPRRFCAGTVPLLSHGPDCQGVGLGSEVQFFGAENGETVACLSLHNDGHLTQLRVDSTLPGAELRMLGSLLPHLHRALQRISPAPSSGSNPLSHRERDIFYWMMHGKTNWEIATILDISERTVKFHAANIIRKLDANNRIHAIVLGLQKGLAA